MTPYEILDIIADSYNPLILIFALYVVIAAFINNIFKGTIKAALLFSLLATVYLNQAIDTKLKAWQYFDSDYSTHTVFSFAIVIFFIFEHKKQKILVALSFVLYLALMLYQQYHTLTDILSTIAILSHIMYFLAYYSLKQLTKRPG